MQTQLPSFIQTHELISTAQTGFRAQPLIHVEWQGQLQVNY